MKWRSGLIAIALIGASCTSSSTAPPTLDAGPEALGPLPDDLQQAWRDLNSIDLVTVARVRRDTLVQRDTGWTMVVGGRRDRWVSGRGAPDGPLRLQSASPWSVEERRWDTFFVDISDSGGVHRLIRVGNGPDRSDIRALLDAATFPWEEAIGREVLIGELLDEMEVFRSSGEAGPRMLRIHGVEAFPAPSPVVDTSGPREKWNASRPAVYIMTLSLTNAVWHGGTEWTLSVEGSRYRVLATEAVSYGSADAPPRTPTVESIFDALDSLGGGYAEATFHPTLGYPTRVFFDPDDGVADEESLLTVSLATGEDFGGGESLLDRCRRGLDWNLDAIVEVSAARLIVSSSDLSGSTWVTELEIRETRFKESGTADVGDVIRVVEKIPHFGSRPLVRVPEGGAIVALNDDFVPGTGVEDVSHEVLAAVQVADPDSGRIQDAESFISVLCQPLD